MEKKTYEAPEVVEYGSIEDRTFTTPGGNVKGCTTVCHLDNFTENSSVS